jgi:hypothetical protein
MKSGSRTGALNPLVETTVDPENGADSPLQVTMMAMLVNSNYCRRLLLQ